MCGIVGIIGTEPAAPLLLDALKRLEYRGYDSAGLATVSGDGAMHVLRASGKLRNLEKRLGEAPLAGTTGIGHTRWATHGAPTEANAHPHVSGPVAVVHNGIIENFRELRAELSTRGTNFASETDTETIAHIMDGFMKEGLSIKDALIKTRAKLQGAYALAFTFEGETNTIAAARHGSPLAIGIGDGGMMIGSDAIALAPFTDTIIYLEDGDMALVHAGGVEIFDHTGAPVERAAVEVAPHAAVVEKGSYRHFMLKEIHEQPEVLGRTLSHYLNVGEGTVRADAIPIDFSKVKRVSIMACGTAYLAGLVARSWFERLARLPVDIDVASEYRYRGQPMDGDDLALAISQSGETADTLAGLRAAKRAGQQVAAVVNVATSTMAREAHTVLPTQAGPEIGVASTKAFICQLAALACVAVKAGIDRGTLSELEAQGFIEALIETPGLVADALRLEAEVEQIARHDAGVTTALYIGRGTSHAIALEGALKLKELSYIHAEGYAAGELKHGPIALVDEAVPVVVVAPYDDLFAKTVSNMEEVSARGGRIHLITDQRGKAAAGHSAEVTIALPDAPAFVSPFTMVIPLQLLAYYVAVTNGTDVDQPRNLAKSVTVE